VLPPFRRRGEEWDKEWARRGREVREKEQCVEDGAKVQKKLHWL
jgi:hypothetical protein